MDNTIGPALAAFAKWAIENSSFDGCDLDGGCVQDKAVELGILTKTSFDPDVNGSKSFCGFEPGEEWYVFSDDFKASLKDTAQPAKKRAE